MKARAFETPIGTRIYFDKYKFAANTINDGKQWQAYRVDCWPEEWMVFVGETLYDVAEQVEKYCKKLKTKGL